MFEAAEIKRLIGAGLPCEFVEVQGDDGVHFAAIVVSPNFEGMTRVNQHRAVKETLGPLMGREIHALQIKTYTPAQWVDARRELGL